MLGVLPRPRLPLPGFVNPLPLIYGQDLGETTCSCGQWSFFKCAFHRLP